MIENNLIQIFLSLLGLPLGYALSKIAPEEVPLYSKHLENLKRIIFISILLTILFLNLNNLTFLLIFLVIGSGLFILEIENPCILSELLIYIFTITAFYFTPSFIITTLLFLYGFPTGTLRK